MKPIADAPAVKPTVPLFPLFLYRDCWERSLYIGTWDGRRRRNALFPTVPDMEQGTVTVM